MALARNVSSGQAARYYDQDDYYSKEAKVSVERSADEQIDAEPSAARGEDATLEVAPSHWHGQGARALGLEGPVDSEVFKRLSRGELPDGTSLHKAGSGPRRAGTDFEFSAPKSFSIQALVMGDDRLIAVHQQAVAVARERIEVATATRVMRDGVSSVERTRKPVIAEFLHTTSRSGDPNLHSHVLALNLTQRSDGQWRSVDNTALFKEQRLMYDIYLAELARGAKSLGYEITRGQSGAPELARFSREQIEAFSNRSHAIEAKLAERGLTRETASAAQKRTATLSTRDSKKDYDRAALRADWRARAAAIGLSAEIPTPKLRPDHSVEPPSKRETRPDPAHVRRPDSTHRPASPPPIERAERDAAQASVSFALEHLGEREASFPRAELIKTALNHHIGEVGYRAIAQELAHRERRREIIPSADGERVTTSAAIALERRILSYEHAGRSSVPPLVDAALVEQHLAGKHLTKGQAAAVTLIATTNHRIVGIHGLAGTGKTTALSTVKELTSGEHLIGLAPSHSAVKALSESGIASQTIQSWLADRSAPEKLSHRSILIVDEAGLASNAQVASTLKRAEAAGARVIFVGDDKQYAGVEAGRAFSQLKAAGMATASLREMLRQTTPTLAKAAQLSVDQPQQALKYLAVREIADPTERHAQMAKDFIALSPKERAQTLVLTGTNEARRSLNASIRDALRAQGALNPTGVSVDTFHRRDLTRAQSKISGNYGEGDAIRFERTYKRLHVKQGEVWQVKRGDANQLALFDGRGREIPFKPETANPKGFTVGRIEAREISVGDRVKLTASDKDKAFKNGERGVIAGTTGSELTIETHDGRRITLDRREALPLEHAYAATGHSAQGLGADRVMLDRDTMSKTTHHPSFYTDLTRSKVHATVYTNDASRLPAAVMRPSAKSAALDVVSAPVAPSHSAHRPLRS